MCVPANHENELARHGVQHFSKAFTVTTGNFRVKLFTAPLATFEQLNAEGWLKKTEAGSLDMT